MKFNEFLSYLDKNSLYKYAFVFLLISLVPYLYSLCVETEMYGNAFLAFLIIVNLSFDFLILGKLSVLKEKLNENPHLDDENTQD